MKAMLVSVEPKMAPVIPADWTRPPQIDPNGNGGWLDADGNLASVAELPTAPTVSWRATYEITRDVQIEVAVEPDPDDPDDPDAPTTELGTVARRTGTRFTVVGDSRDAITNAVKAELRVREAAAPAAPAAPLLAEEIEA